MVGRRLKFKCVFILGVIYSVRALSGDLEVTFDKLKDVDANYKVVGTVCEQVAKLKLEKEFPKPEYEIATGISYEFEGQVLGELDIVVFKKELSTPTPPSAISAYEVKCCENPEKALKKAREQLKRFRNFLKFKAVLDFVLEPKKIKFSPVQFDESLPLQSISYRGSGFDIALDFSYDELMDLRKKLILAQTQKKYNTKSKKSAK